MDRGTRVAQVVLIAAGLALGLASGRQGRSDRAEIRRLAAVVEEALPPAARAGVAARLRREPDPAAAAAVAARALLARALGEAAATGTPRRTGEEERLERARSLAAAALGARPASWTAALVLGAATYLTRAWARDPRLLTEPEAWEAPLSRARALAPSRREAPRFLAMAYLELWSYLPPGSRARARELVALGLADPGAFDRLIEPWLAVSGGGEAALALMPDAPFAWERLARLYAGRRDAKGQALASERHWRALAGDVGRRLAKAERQLGTGQPARARTLALAAIADLPVDGRFCLLLVRGLRTLPAGPVDPATAARFRQWLGWTLDLCPLGSCPLPPPLVARLAAAAGDLPAPEAALAALAAGDLVRAEWLERRAGGLWQEQWAPYRAVKAAVLAGRGELRRAAAVLEQVPSPRWPDAVLLVARQRLARQAGDAAAGTRAEAALLPLRRERWSAADWRPGADGATLELLAARPAPRLLVEVTGGGEGASVLAVRWDGRTVAIEPVAAGAQVVAVPAAVAAGLHRLEVRTLAGPRVVPGATVLAGGGAG